ncbi:MULTISPECIES: calcium-binding protein [unclassified Paracoccus (in: a-proteobacteria)]|uniref:calcium-binding protein n=1 Tax=unclassified Paracoccus (in: a-proteobacteria) TaxID=2688777 RepID=UPI0012B2481E|nr:MULTISPECIES: calcium-binding protein [unclassified Paracoccus (in: a-proteobacteria)]UXU76136.1 calcium-binding protein [Paracoccus sp. SMMA_5]UXU82048.1 calcium-binding protein [Paracoccus sp. SMMA_5_TC]
MPVITGTAGNDRLVGTSGQDTLTGLAGRDTIDPGHGSDRADGGHGADLLFWDQNPNSTGVIDTYIGGVGGEAYDANLYGALSGGDRLHLGTSAGSGGFRVTFTTTEDGHALDAWGNRLNFTGFERLQTGAGDDRIEARGASILPARGSGSDHVPVHGLTVNSGAGNDYISGTNADDVLYGGTGNDTIYGNGGTDLLMSSAGDDYGHAGDGDDNVRWGNNGGLDPITNIGRDTLVGGNGTDLLNIWAKGDGDNSPGARVVFTTASSGTASYLTYGTLTFSEFEQYWTHEGKDTVIASGARIGVNEQGIWFNTRWGDDRITGSNGRDWLEGGDGADTIDGGRGNDLISLFEDIYIDGLVTPDAYRDVLVVRDGAGIDTIRGFQLGDLRNAAGEIVRYGDRLSLGNLHDAQGNRVDVNDVRVTSNRDGHAVLSFPNGEQLVLEGVSAGALNRTMLNRIGIPNPVATNSTATPTTAAARTAEPAPTESAVSGANLALDAPMSEGPGAETAPSLARAPALWQQISEAVESALQDHSHGQALPDLYLHLSQALERSDFHSVLTADGFQFDWT